MSFFQTQWNVMPVRVYRYEFSRVVWCVFLLVCCLTTPSLPLLPVQLSVWIVALSVHPVRLRDALWSALDTDRPVRWDDSHKWRRTQTGTCNVTRLQCPPPPFLSSSKIHIHAMKVGGAHKGWWARFLTSWAEVFFWAWEVLKGPPDRGSRHMNMKKCTWLALDFLIVRDWTLTLLKAWSYIVLCCTLCLNYSKVSISITTFIRHLLSSQLWKNKRRVTVTITTNVVCYIQYNDNEGLLLFWQEARLKWHQACLLSSVQ